MIEMNMEHVIEEVIKRVKEKAFIKVEASGRHVHLSREAVDILFGEGYELTKVKELSQPGQYSCKERVNLTGPKGTIKNVAVLGPERAETQVELSKTDALIVGVKPPVRESGKIKGSAGITISTERASLVIEEGVIVAMRHIHLCPEDAKLYGVKDKDIVKVKVYGERPLIFDDVLIRVSENYRSFMHIDYDEANACGHTKATLAKIIK